MHSLLSLCVILALFLFETSFRVSLHHMGDISQSGHIENQKVSVHLSRFVKTDPCFCVAQTSFDFDARMITLGPGTDYPLSLSYPLDINETSAPKWGVSPFCLSEKGGVAQGLGVECNNVSETNRICALERGVLSFFL